VRSFERIIEEGIAGVEALSPASADDVPASFAVLGTGGTEDEVRVVVGFAPGQGGDAALATLAFAQRLAAEQDFRGEAIAVAPQWSIASRRRLGLIGELPFRFRALVASTLAEGEGRVEPEPSADAAVVPVHHVATRLDRAADRDLFLRALAAFQGLAAKHGGAVRGYDSQAELVLLARRVAVLRAEGDGVALETLLPERSRAKLAPDGLATAMDRLEGLLRKRLNDRRIRSSEDGLRAQLAPLLAEAAGLRAKVSWPLGGSDPEVLDLAGADERGRVAVAAVRKRMTLPALGSILDALLVLRPALSVLLAPAEVAAHSGPPRLLLAAKEFDDAVLQVLPTLTLEHASYDVRSRRGRGPELELRESPRPAASRRTDRDRRSVSEPAAEAARSAPVEPSEEQREEGARPPARRRRRAGPEPSAPRLDEISLFDLDDEDGSAEPETAASPRRRRRSRGRGRGRRGPVAGAEQTAEERPPPAEPDLDDGAEQKGEERPMLAEPDLDEVSEVLIPLTEPLADEVEGLVEMAEPAYDDDEPMEEADADGDRLRLEREARLRARLAKAAPAPEVREEPRPPRRRAVFVSHADRDSLVATILLARDIRLVEGFWVYPQDELMTFFRSVATDLRPETPIHLVGFTASPARDALQAAALYRERLAWFDHHEWPPEDLEGLRQAIGHENVHIEPGAGSSLPAVLALRTRRSRFSDRLVELATGRFTQHDFQRWGRVWWHRLGEIAARSGERRADVEPLLAGRPSDLAREAASVPAPPVPPEVEYVLQRDFRLVHFGSYVLVVVPTPAGPDPLLASRVARARYAAEISLAFHDGDDLIALGCDEGRGRRGHQARLDHGARRRGLRGADARP
jgi:hypothetical protein